MRFSATCFGGSGVINRLRTIGRRLYRAHAVVPLVVSVLFIVVAAFAFNDFNQYPWGALPANIPNNCKDITADSPWQPTGAFVAVVAAFLLGGLLGKLKHRSFPPDQEVAGRAVQLNLTILSLAMTLAWGYETLAVASNRVLEPITQYIMCIKGHQSDWTLLVFIVGALIAGRWLWHRPGSFL